MRYFEEKQPLGAGGPSKAREDRGRCYAACGGGVEVPSVGWRVGASDGVSFAEMLVEWKCSLCRLQFACAFAQSTDCERAGDIRVGLRDRRKRECQSSPHTMSTASPTPAITSKNEGSVENVDITSHAPGRSAGYISPKFSERATRESPSGCLQQGNQSKHRRRLHVRALRAVAGEAVDL
jgi:hypothetical protein